MILGYDQNVLLLVRMGAFAPLFANRVSASFAVPWAGFVAFLKYLL